MGCSGVVLSGSELVLGWLWLALGSYELVLSDSEVIQDHSEQSIGLQRSHLSIFYTRFFPSSRIQGQRSSLSKFRSQYGQPAK